jgi:hypothetical protein
MTTKTFRTIQLAGVLAVGIVAATPSDATAQVNNSGIREIPIYGPEWQATPWCDTGDSGPVYLYTNPREPLPLVTVWKTIARRRIPIYTYYSVDSYLYNGGWYDCVIDLRYDYWVAGHGGQPTEYTPDATVMRSYYLPVGAEGTVRSGRIGNGVVGDGGAVSIDASLNPSMLLYTPNGSWPLAAYYSCP